MKGITSINNFIEEGLRLAWDEGPEPALQLLNTLMQKEPCHARLHHALGIIHSSCTGNRMTAEQYFRKAIQLDPLFVYPYWHLSKMLAEDERFDDALKIFQCGMDEKK